MVVVFRPTPTSMNRYVHRSVQENQHGPKIIQAIRTYHQLTNQFRLTIE